MKEGSPESSGRRDSDDRFMNSPDTRESSNYGSDCYHGDKYRPGFGSPQVLDRVEWRPAPRLAKPTFARINGPQPSNSSHLGPHRQLSQTATPMGDHPMAVSTSLAYGYHPMFALHSIDSPSPATGSAAGSRRPTLASEHSLPSLRHSDSLSSVNSAGSSLSTSNGSLPPLNRALESREQPFPFPQNLPRPRQRSLRSRLLDSLTAFRPRHLASQPFCAQESIWLSTEGERIIARKSIIEDLGAPSLGS